MYYARLMAVHGAGPDRRTPSFKTARGLKHGVRRELKRLRLPGPYLVTEYESGRRVTSYMED